MRHHQKKFLIFFVILAIFLIIILAYFFASYKNPKDVLLGLLPKALAVELTQEYIQDFQSVLTINGDNTIDVQEKIIYDFGNQQRHGIYREIPYKYQAKGGNFTVDLKVQSVINENQNPYSYQVTRGSGLVKIKIGDPDQLVSGVQTYFINYRVGRVINFFSTHDELYWNVTGNGWPVPIDRAGVIIKLPSGLKAEDLQAQCFTGLLGSKEENCQVTNVSNSQVGYSMFNILGPGQGLTVVLGWPKGILTPPSVITQIKWILRDNPLMLLPLLSFMVMFLLWYFHGRDLGKRQSIIPIYQAPDSLLPAEVGSLIDERVNLVDISSTIIDLAVRGYIKIKEAGRGDWELVKLKDFADLNAWEKEFIEEVFKGQGVIKISGLASRFYRHLPNLKKGLYQNLVRKNFFPVSPSKVRALYFFIGFALVFSGLLVVPFFLGGLNILYLLISGIIIIALGQIMPYKTKTGSKVLEKIKGYKMYLAVAEKERIKFHNAPAKKPEIFEKHLPYAMVLGVEKQWARQFQDIYLKRPDWYEGNFTVFNSLIFVDSLSSLNYSAKSLLAAKPAGAASGSSGFSGGGFSGGGFGGGGGSW